MSKEEREARNAKQAAYRKTKAGKRSAVRCNRRYLNKRFDLKEKLQETHYRLA